MGKVRVRIAPSPTGEDLHIGNVYTALLNYVFAKKNSGKFIVRIEDTDKDRLLPGSAEKILSSLKWLGLDYDEGPGVGGNYGPYRQSERLPLYIRFAQKLIEKKAAYRCFCTPETLEKMREKQEARKEAPKYDGRCKFLKKEETESFLRENKKHVIRLNVPEQGKTKFFDVVRGEISFENKLIDDQVLIKSDGFPTYHLAVVVDDHLMEISHIIRAEEWISSTPKHVLIYEALGWVPPIFAHGPILRNANKSKLSKRKNPVWVSWYKSAGFLPEAILNYLALMGWSMPNQEEIFSLSKMSENFRLEDLKPVGPAFDLKKLEWFNGFYIRQMTDLKLQRKLKNFSQASLESIQHLAPLFKDRLRKLSDFDEMTKPMFRVPELSLDIFLFEGMARETAFRVVNLALKVLVVNLDSNVLEVKIRKASKDWKMSVSDAFMVLRIAIYGSKTTPPLDQVIKVLGKKRTVERLEKALEILRI